MRQLSRKEFRWVSLTGIFLLLLGFGMDYFDLPAKGEDVKTLQQWNYFDSIASTSFLTAVFVYSQASLAVGSLGFLFFKPWGRALLLFSMAVWNITFPFAGVMILPPVSGSFSSLGGLTLVMVLTLSYFPPHSDYFIDRPTR